MNRPHAQRGIVVRAPGKVLLTGAYAVLEGAPALVVAVDRYATAYGGEVARHPSREVLAVLPADQAPEVDMRELYDGDAKLGLGSSAAVLVASLGARWASEGRDLGAAAVRDDLARRAFAAHASVQDGGSGVDVAASVHGGVLACRRGAQAKPHRLPEGLTVSVVWSGTSARTTDLRARVEALRARDASVHHACIEALAKSSEAALGATRVDALLAAAQGTGRALEALGTAADAPIVPEAFRVLGLLAADDGAAFYPSGAGGGDVGVHLASVAPSATFRAHLATHGMRLLPLGIDRRGVHVHANEV